MCISWILLSVCRCIRQYIKNIKGIIIYSEQVAITSYRLVISYCYYLPECFTLFSFRLLFLQWCSTCTMHFISDHSSGNLCLFVSSIKSIISIDDLDTKEVILLVNCSTRTLTFTVIWSPPHLRNIQLFGISGSNAVLFACRYLIPTGLIMAQVPTVPYYY